MQWLRALRPALLAALLLAAISLPARAQAPEAGGVGIALRGGAALGLAHIGVLQWLEEHRVPVEYIAGTSMGGLVGGMYAVGMSPAEMRRLVGSIDWEDAFRGRPPYQTLSFRRKEDRQRFQGGVEFGLRGGVRWPLGLDPAHPVGLIFSRVTYPYSTVSHFDALPIPFRCVAVDILTGQVVVLGEGSLTEALRATMAIPGLFTPVGRNGQVLVDGGMLNNLPTDVVRDMGAGAVIAVDFEGVGGSPKRVDSVLEMLDQAVTIMTRQSVQRNLPLADVVVRPNLEGYGTEDYRSVDALADRGYQAAEAKAAELLKYAVTPEQWQAYLERRQARQRVAPCIPAFITVTGTGPEASRAIVRRLVRHIGRPLNPLRLEADLTAITGWGRFESLSYEQAHSGGRTGLRIRVKEKPYGPPFVNTTLNVGGAEPDDTQFEIPARLTVFDLGGWGTEWRTDLVVGSRAGLATEYYRPLHGNWFLAPHAYYDRVSRAVLQGGDATAEYVTRDVGLGLDLGRSLGTDAELRLGLLLGHRDASVRVGGPSVPDLSGITSAAVLRYRYDSRDTPVVPTRGLQVGVDTRWLFHAPGTHRGSPKLEAQVSAFHPMRPGRTLFGIAAASTTFGYGVPLVQQFSLSGPLRLSASANDTFAGRHITYLAGGYLRQVSHLSPPLGGNIYLGAWHEWGRSFGGDQTATFLNATTGGVVAETMLGPAFLGASWARGSGPVFSFALGSLF